MRVAPEGWIVLIPLAAACVLAALGLTWLHPAAGVAGWLAAILLIGWGLWFFRDPLRRAPAGADLVLSPADGRVIKVGTAPLPAELRDAWPDAPPEGLPRVAIFLNLFNVHVNRVPAAGAITATAYVKGRFFNASLDKASEHNERSGAVLLDPHGRRVAFVQIAGLVARRIVNHLKVGQQVAAGERFGLIRFGSRAEVYLPPGSAIRVSVGQHVVAGESTLATLPAAAGAAPKVGA